MDGDGVETDPMADFRRLRRRDDLFNTVGSIGENPRAVIHHWVAVPAAIDKD